MQFPRSTQPDRRARGRVPWFVFGVTLLLSGLAAWYVGQVNRTRANMEFDDVVAEVRDNVTDAVDRYVTALRGTAALFDTFGAVGPAQFHTFVSHVDVQGRYPGIRLIAFAPRVPAAEIPQFVASARAGDIPDYHVWPAGSLRDEYFPVRYQEPYSAAHHEAMGHDLPTDPPRLAALDRACDTAAPAMTGKVELTQHIGPGPVYGFIIYVPLFRGGKTPPTLAQRRADLLGYVFGIFDANDFFHHVLNPVVHKQLSLQIYSGTPSKASLLYDTASSAPDPVSFTPHHYRTVETPLINGQSWTLQAVERRRFDTDYTDNLPPLIFVGGAGISFVLFAVTRGMAMAQAESERSAADLLVASRALRASQARLRRLVESNLIGVFFCDAAGTITDANDEFLRMIGLARADLSARPITLESITPPQFHHDDAIALSSLKTFGVGPSYEKELLRPDGSRVPVLIGMASVDADEQEAASGSAAAPRRLITAASGAMVAFTIDITQRRLAERELRQAKDSAEQANRSKDQFLAVLSHELRTPLTPVLAAAAAAQTDDQLSADTRDLFSMIHRNVELEARLIDDLLDLTRVSRGKLQLHLTEVDLHEILTHAAHVCDPEDLKARRLTLELQLNAADRYVRGDPARLQQVFWNLVKNAVKFTPPGGTITLSTRNEPAGPQFGTHERTVIVADVTDTGIGIEPDVLSKVFDAFEQGSAARAEASGGLGLGLAISRGLVAGHGGAITASSPGRDRGTTFSVRLLTIAAPAPAPVPARSLGPAAGTGEPLNILLVEDHLDTAKIMSRLLRSNGHRVQLAHCVADALRHSQDATLDVLISDLGLPDGSGLDIIREFRRHAGNAHLQAIALTGYGTDHDVRRSHEAGFNDHLTKPINFDALRQTIARAQARRAEDRDALRSLTAHDQPREAIPREVPPNLAVEQL